MTTSRDADVLPPGLTAADFAAALRAFAGALGDGAVLRSAGEAGEFRDPYAFAAWDEHWPSAVLMPGSVEEVQEVVRIAGRFRVPLWTNSMGKNNAYGRRLTAEAGYGLYRGHLSFMDDIAGAYGFGDHAMRRLQETLKDALDPDGILSPGKQGIWPRGMRNGRD